MVKSNANKIEIIFDGKELLMTCLYALNWVNSNTRTSGAVTLYACHQNSSSETECGGAATDEMPPQRWVYGWI